MNLELSEATICDAILACSRVDRPGGKLFCLGPNFGRISFQSQQIRALNLVWALRKKELFDESSKVAVVGAGISGVTAAFALRAYGAKVLLFDRGGRPLYRLRDTTHRNVHPTINWWPMEPDLHPTTTLPFLDWHLGQCDQVIKELDAQWVKLLKNSRNYLRFFEFTEVEEAVSSRASDGRITLKTNKQDVPNIDIVVVSSGFGEEIPLAQPDIATQSYWDNDDLEGIRDDPGPIKRFVVSGFGDGGQIDALRLAYDFDFGRLSFRIAEVMKKEVSERIAAVEAERENVERWAGLSLKYEDIAEDIHKPPTAAYRQLRNLLEENIQDRAQLVVLIDKLKRSPYESWAAPVHKLMVAYAVYKGIITYRQCEIEATGDENVYKVGSDVYSKVDTKFVIRHGAHPFNSGLVKAHEWEKLEHSQRNTSEYNYKPAWGEDVLAVPEGWYCRKNQAPDYASAMRKQAQTAISSLGSGGWVQVSNARYVVFGHDISFKPKYLFGIPVVYKDASKTEVARAL